MLTPIDINGLTIVALGVLLTAVVLNDIKTHRIENVSVMAIILLGLISQLLGNGVPGVFDWLSGMAFGMCFLLPFYIGGGMGAGDVKLLAAVGSVLGPIPTILAGGVTLAAGAAFGLFMLFMYKPNANDLIQQDAGTQIQSPPALINRKYQLPYAAAIAMGAIAGLLYAGRLQDFFGVLV